MTNTRTIFEESIFVAGRIGTSVGNGANLLRLHQIFVALQHEIPQRRDIRSTGRTTDEQLFAFKKRIVEMLLERQYELQYKFSMFSKGFRPRLNLA